MHVVNDKVPGRLIIVMAGARGISGKNFPLITLRFRSVAPIKDKMAVEIKIDHIEMMNEALKPVSGRVNLKAIALLRDRVFLALSRIVRSSALRASDSVTLCPSPELV